jgi:hypothetical protein
MSVFKRTELNKLLASDDEDPGHRGTDTERVRIGGASTRIDLINKQEQQTAKGPCEAAPLHQGPSRGCPRALAGSRRA